MKMNRYVSSLANAKADKSSWKTIALLLAATNLLTGFFVVTADTSEKTIVTPTSLQQTFWVRGDEVSPEYLAEMTKFFASELLTYNPSNAESQFSGVLKYVDPSEHGALQARFADDADRIKRNAWSSSFFPVEVDVNKDTVIIGGELVGFVGQQVVGRKTRFYQFDYKYNGGSLRLLAFKEVEKDAGGRLFIDSETGDHEIRIEQQTPAVDAAVPAAGQGAQS